MWIYPLPPITMVIDKNSNGYYCSQVWDPHQRQPSYYQINDEPPTVTSTRNRLLIAYYNYGNGFSEDQSRRRIGFVAYYESMSSIRVSDAIMAASLTGHEHYPQAVAFFSSPLINASGDSNCLTFVYTLRSNLRVKITSHIRTITLINWNVDGGRAFHRATLNMPKGIYKIIWETTHLREHGSSGNSPHHRYRATVKEIVIHPMRCQIVGRSNQ